jgi:hypothetical protein
MRGAPDDTGDPARASRPALAGGSRGALGDPAREGTGASGRRGRGSKGAPEPVRAPFAHSPVMAAGRGARAALEDACHADAFRASRGVGWVGAASGARVPGDASGEARRRVAGRVPGNSAGAPLRRRGRAGAGGPAAGLLEVGGRLDGGRRGAGFGLGLYVGLRAFDDAVDSDRKVWTTAVLAGAAGAVAGCLVGRARRSDRSPRPAAVRPGPRQDGAAAEGDTAGIGGRRPAPVLAEGEAVRFELRHVGLREMARCVVPRSGDAALVPAR